MARQVKPKAGSGVPGSNAQPSAGLKALAGNVAEMGPRTPTSALGPGNGTANPWETDPNALGRINSARTNQGQANLQIAANRALGEQEFGLRHELGANGIYYDDYRNNPWSQAALLQHAHESNAAGINVTAGQALYSGQTGNAQGIEAGNFARGRYGLEGDVNAAEARWRAEEAAAQKQREDEEWEAKEKAAERAAEQEPPDVPLGGSPSQQGGGVTRKKAKVVKKNGKVVTGTLGVGGARRA